MLASLSLAKGDADRIDAVAHAGGSLRGIVEEVTEV
jgi:hypothetical protein